MWLNLILKAVTFVFQNNSYLSNLSMEIIRATVRGFIRTGSALLCIIYKYKDQKLRKKITIYKIERDTLIYFQYLIDMIVLAVDETINLIKLFKEEFLKDIINIPHRLCCMAPGLPEKA